MLKTENYKEEIFELVKQGKSGREIQKILGFKNHQPVYNFFRKYNISNPDRIYKRKYTLDENYFYNINTSEKAYILGFIAADGCVSEDRLVISISINDKHLLEKIKKEFKSNQVLREVIKENPHTKLKTCHMVTLQISSKKFVKPLIDMDLKAKTYSLNSNILKFIPKYLIRDFLRGYFDGDGNVMWGKKYLSGYKYNINICGNKEFLLNTYQKYFYSPNKLYYDKKSKQMHIWKLSSKENVRNFLSYLYNNSSIHLTRKYKIYLLSKRENDAHVKPL